jgi:2-methylcitrate dehydratase PrpD
MMAKVERILDPQIEARGFDKIRSTIEVDLVDGRRLVEHADERYRGGPDRPFTRDELRDKFVECAALVLPPSRIEETFAVLESIENLPDLAELVQSLTPALSGVR